MKKVVSGVELKSKIGEALDILCDTVSSTLGPTGNNVLINNDEDFPFITNDGVTIASSIESEDLVIDTILDIAKEASLKTDEIVGDGTTTTLVLLKSIYEEGLKEISSGKNPITIKKELNEELNNILRQIDGLKRKPTNDDLISVGSISAGDIEIGKFLVSIFDRVKHKYAIRITTSNNEKTYYKIDKGYSIDTDIPNIIQEDIEMDNCYIGILRGYLSDLNVLSDIINECINLNKNLVILSSDYDENIERELLAYFNDKPNKIYVFKTPDYGKRKITIENDIAHLSKANIKNVDYEKVYSSDFGKVNKIIVNKNGVIIINDIDAGKKINEIEQVLDKCEDDYEKEFHMNRLSKFQSGIATVYVGGNSKTEKKELVMRYIDAVSAIDMAYNGVSIGEGITLLKVSHSIENTILKKALTVPFLKIMENAGENAIGRMNDIENSNFNKIYNFRLGAYENIDDTKIIDPTLVIMETIKNAVSIASMLLTTNYLVIKEKIKNSTIEL